MLTSLTGGIQNVMAFFGVNDATDVAQLQSVWTKLCWLGVRGVDVFLLGEILTLRILWQQ